MAAVNTNSHTESQFLLRRDLPLFSCQSDTDRYSALDICLAAERMRELELELELENFILQGL